jgi:hypothetical protein
MIMKQVVCFSGGCMDRYGTLETYKTPWQLLLRIESLPSCYVRPSNNYCAMFDALFPAFLALLIIDSAHAQVFAPNCSDSIGGYTWVGYPWLVAEFQL